MISAKQPALVKNPSDPHVPLSKGGQSVDQPARGPEETGMRVILVVDRLTLRASDTVETPDNPFPIQCDPT